MSNYPPGVTDNDPYFTDETPPEDEEGIGGDEPFCEHGNLLWSEDRDKCIQESWALTDRITAAIRKGDR